MKPLGKVLEHFRAKWVPVRVKKMRPNDSQAHFRISKKYGNALAAAALTLVASTGAKAQVTLDVLYAFPAFAKFHEPIAAEFMKKHPDIKINFRAPAASYDEGHQAMLRSSVTNQLPDVYYSGFHLLTELVETLDKRKQVVDLGPLLKAEPEAWRKANYSDALLSLGQVAGKRAGLAFNASTPLMYFNAELVKKAGGDPRQDARQLGGHRRARQEDPQRRHRRHGLQHP